MREINGYDFDGVTSIGVTPREGDVIITGRCFDECYVIFDYLKDHNLLDKIPVYFNPIQFNYRGEGTEYSRSSSAKHKASILQKMLDNSVNIGYFFEDDPLQKDIIIELVPEMQDKVILIPQTVKF